MGKKMNLKNSYCDYPEHKEFRYHYFQGQFGGFLLAFTKEWQDKYLPADSRHKERPFLLVLKDMEDNKLYDTWMSVAYEPRNIETVQKEDYSFASCRSILSYFYGSHHCPCHRKQDAKNAGAIVLDEECEGNRFLIDKIECENLILFSETRTQEELEKELGFNNVECWDIGFGLSMQKKIMDERNKR